MAAAATPSAPLLPGRSTSIHHTANGTVIHTHTLEPHVALVWSGGWNFIRVLTSTGAVAFVAAWVLTLPVSILLSGGLYWYSVTCSRPCGRLEIRRV